MTASTRVVTIVGTRPEIIRLSRVIARLDASCHHRLVHTGQNYDPELSQVLFRDLQIRDPDDYLAVGAETLGEMLGDAFRGIEKFLARERPDAVLVLGDTNSALAALMAKRMGITVFHMEAGNRCYDANVPEEINRKILDHFADVNLVYTEHARRNLLAEGLSPQRIYLTGSPLREVLTHYEKSIQSSAILAQLNLESRGYFLLSLHREENVDDPDRLLSLLDGVEALSRHHGLPVIATTHPRTRKRIAELDDSAQERAIQFLPPFGYLDYVALQQGARCVISDSGTISEESAMLGFPAITTRDSIERPEAMDTGSIIVAGATEAGLVDAVDAVLQAWDVGDRAELPADYAVRNCSQRVVNLVVSLSKLQPVWDGLHRPKRGQAR